MADRHPWFKLWATCLSDPDLHNLSLEDWARWVRLGVYTKIHGTKGKIIFNPPFLALINLFNLSDIGTIRSTLARFPHLIVSNDLASLQIVINFKNWHKYQVDYSADRVRRFRSKRNGIRRDVEEKRREEKLANGVTPSFGTSKPGLKSWMK